MTYFSPIDICIVSVYLAAVYHIAVLVDSQAVCGHEHKCTVSHTESSLSQCHAIQSCDRFVFRPYKSGAQEGLLTRASGSEGSHFRKLNFMLLVTI
jgi:hypothetical protein